MPPTITTVGPDDELVALRDAHVELGITLNSTYRLVRAGRLPVVDVSATSRPSWRVRRQDLDTYAAARRTFREGVGA